MAHRDCDICDSIKPATHRVTPWADGKRLDKLHTYLCPDCVHKHKTKLHKDGYGCVELRPIISMAAITNNKIGVLDIDGICFREEKPER